MGGILLLVGLVLGAFCAVAWVRWWLARKTPKQPQAPAVSTSQRSNTALEKSARENVEHIFNDEFREELRNRGRLHFEKIIGENAMFLQQDLRQTTTQLNDYMRSEITRTLQAEFKKYEQSITDAKQMAIDSIEKTITTIEQQRQFLEKQLETQNEAQKAEVLKRFEVNIAAVVNHYVVQAIGDQIDLTDQLDYILAEMEANKNAIIEDIRRGS